MNAEPEQLPRDDKKPDDKKQHKFTGWFNLAMLPVGGGALAWMLSQMKWHEVRNTIEGIGWFWAVAILVLELGSLCCDAASLYSFIHVGTRTVRYPRVLAAYASGRAINVLTPGGALGEATKVTLLEGHVPRSRVISSLVIKNVASLYLQVAIMIIGIPITMLLVDLPSAIKVAVFIGMAVLIPATIVVGVMIHRGAISSVVGLIRRTHVISADRAKRWKEKLVEVDKHIRQLHRDRTHGTNAGLWFVLAGHVLTSLSTVAIMVAIGLSLTPTLVIGMLSVGVLITWIASIIPLGLGLQDGGNYALYQILGATGDHGFAVTQIARARQLLVAIVGLVIMLVMKVLRRDRASHPSPSGRPAVAP